MTEVVKDKKEIEINDIRANQLKNGYVELAEFSCHLIWGFILIVISLAVPYLTLRINTKYLSITFLGLSVVILFLIILILFLLYQLQLGNKVNLAKEKTLVPFSSKNQKITNEEELTSFFKLRKRVINFREFFRNGLFRKEFFSWILFYTGILVSFSEVFASSKQSIDYLKVLNNAAEGLTKAAVISIIVLFFVQIMKYYKETTFTLQDAADNSLEASKTALEASSTTFLKFSYNKNRVKLYPFCISI